MGNETNVFKVDSGSGLDEELDEVVVLSTRGQVQHRVLQRRLRVLHLSLSILVLIEGYFKNYKIS
jgi:hypothetical protein